MERWFSWYTLLTFVNVGINVACKRRTSQNETKGSMKSGEPQAAEKFLKSKARRETLGYSNSYCFMFPEMSFPQSLLLSIDVLPST